MSKKFKFSTGPIGPGALPLDFTGVAYDLNIYATETTQRFVLGTRAEFWDGRKYVYSKSAAACISGQGCEHTKIGYTAITNFAVAVSVGNTSVTVPAATHAALTEDYLAGGYICIFDGSTNNTQFRGIVGNDAAAANALFVVYLDAPLTEAVVAATSKCETYESPYIGLQTGTSASLPKAGVPAAKVSAANVYFWCQIEGYTWVAPQGTVINNEGVGVMWRHDGSLEALATAIGGTVPDADTTQYAGHLAAGSYTLIGPLLNLRG